MPVILALVIVAILIIVVIAGSPSQFIMARSGTILAPPDKVFPHVNDLRSWDAWSPWAKLDPNAKNSFEGAASGVGAAMSWDGNKKIGAGRMTIVESRPSDLIRLKLEFIRPLVATNMAEFRFISDGPQTVVTWKMTGKSNLFFKAFHLFVDCEKMAGKDFEKGLAGLKRVVEVEAPAVPAQV
jgi:hypothetical protein